MNSSLAQVATALISVAVISALVFVGSGGEEDTDGGESLDSASATVTEATSPPSEVSLIEVGERGPIDGVADLRYDVGDRVRLVVRGQTNDEVHVHGYSLTASLAPNRPAELSFPGTMKGVFRAELERSGTQVARLTIRE